MIIIKFRVYRMYCTREVHCVLLSLVLIYLRSRFLSKYEYERLVNTLKAVYSMKYKVLLNVTMSFVRKDNPFFQTNNSVTSLLTPVCINYLTDNK